MHALGLASGVSFCVVSDQLILLDLVSDSYFQLSEQEAEALRHVAKGGDPGPRALALLRRNGILESQPHPAMIKPVNLPQPDISLLEGNSLGVSSACSVAAIALRLFWVRTRLCLGGLAELINSLKFAKLQGGRSEASPNREALSFAASRRWIPIATCCLSDSLTLALHLAHLGFNADLVIGVKLDPFAAHAWVQHGGVVLNDGLDGVLDFTPILIV